ncbi:1438_t:CDS:2 [Cetraspora pellucida]|uniref:1438_t:CDS:1 n=1 Tax=Cetraspora pellucida TaxID=1433469 RepID=A0A9N9ATK5_9GLOM|nr:1438_t:CDS:2 [Cetraspora pellucida]
MIPICIQAAHQLKNYWMKRISDNKEERITITDFISKITLDIIGLVGFNYEFNSLTSGSELGRAHNAISEYDLTPIYSALTDCFPFIRKILFSFNIKYLNGLKVTKNISEKFVTDIKNNHILSNNLFSLLVKTNENLSDDEKLDDDELISQVKTILLSQVNVHILLSWILQFLAKNLVHQDCLREELSNAFFDLDHHPTADEIDKLKYLDCVLKETLRLVPSVLSLVRKTTKDEIMNGYLVPKETTISISLNAIHCDPLIWSDNADEFDPSRWLDPNLKSKLSIYNYLPFGAGLRGIAKPLPGIDLWVSKVDK